MGAGKSKVESQMITELLRKWRIPGRFLLRFLKRDSMIDTDCADWQVIGDMEAKRKI